MIQAIHLGRRFFGSLRPKSLDGDELAWISAQLLDAEFGLWQRMNTADRRHSYIVGRRAEEYLGEAVTRPAIAAAILHDIGKVEAEIGTIFRVVATLAATTASPSLIESWAEESGWLGRAGRYLRHHEIGAEMLKEAGSDPLTYTWAREHELPQSVWTLPPEITDALKRADDI